MITIQKLVGVHASRYNYYKATYLFEFGVHIPYLLAFRAIESALYLLSA